MATSRLNASSSAAPLSTAAIAPSTSPARARIGAASTSRRQLQEEIVDRPEPASAERGGHFLDHPEAEVLEHGHRVRQRQQAAALIDLEPQQSGHVARVAIEPRVPARAVPAAEPAQAADVDRGLGRAVGMAVGRRKSLGIARGDGGGARRTFDAGELGFDSLAPAAHHHLQPGVELGFVGLIGRRRGCRGRSAAGRGCRLRWQGSSRAPPPGRRRSAGPGSAAARRSTPRRAAARRRRTGGDRAARGPAPAAAAAVPPGSSCWSRPVRDRRRRSRSGYRAARRSARGPATCRHAPWGRTRAFR